MIIYELETDTSFLYTNTRTSWLQNEREIFNTARSEAECGIEKFEFILQPASACICVQKTSFQSLTLLIFNLNSLH